MISGLWTMRLCHGPWQRTLTVFLRSSPYKLGCLPQENREEEELMAYYQHPGLAPSPPPQTEEKDRIGKRRAQ